MEKSRAAHTARVAVARLLNTRHFRHGQQIRRQLRAKRRCQMRKPRQPAAEHHQMRVQHGQQARDTGRQQVGIALNMRLRLRVTPLPAGNDLRRVQ